jgi:hypothetical protein
MEESSLTKIGILTVSHRFERKHKMLKARLVKVTALAAGVAANPVPLVDVAANCALLAKEVCHYMHVSDPTNGRIKSNQDWDINSVA